MLLTYMFFILFFQFFFFQLKLCITNCYLYPSKGYIYWYMLNYKPSWLYSSEILGGKKGKKVDALCDK